LANRQNGISATGKQLQIFTLGRFAIVKGDEVLTEASERSIKMWELLKYLIVHHGKVHVPENLIEQLWPDQEYADAKNTLRSMIHRLRKHLGSDIELIRFSQGGYTLNRHQDLWLDLHVFEDSCTDARQAVKLGRIDEALTLYRQALSCYKGDLLPESLYSDWLIPARNYYHRMYLQSSSEFAQLLKQENLYSEMAHTMSKTLMIDDYDENIHILLIEALLAEGKVTDAKAHYEKTTEIFYRELGIKPSSAFKQAFRLIKAHEDANSISDMMLLRGEFKSKGQEHGAFVCDPEFFRYLYQLESNRAQRTGNNGLLTVFTINPKNNRNLSNNTHTSDMQTLKDILKRSLRNTDVLCNFSDNQILVLLPTTTPEQGNNIIGRLLDISHNSGVSFKVDVTPLNQQVSMYS